MSLDEVLEAMYALPLDSESSYKLKSTNIRED